jgi:ATP-dependent Lhr-like helicase
MFEEEEDPSALYVGDWLAFYGPIDPAEITRKLGLSEERVRVVLEDLVATERIISGDLIEGDDIQRICDASNFESLLRISRADAVPDFEALPIESLQLFVARYQGVTQPQEGVDGVVRSLEQLSCYEAPAAAWESEFLPARVQDYTSSQMDALIQEGGAGWLGKKNKRISFFIEPDFDLLFDDDEPDPSAGEITSLFPDVQGKYDFMTLSKQTGMTAKALSDRLWEGVWASSIANDSYASVRKGLETQFEIPVVAAQGRTSARRPRRSTFGAWRGALPLPGNWFTVSAPEPPADFVEREEKNKDRVRVLLDRYGILFRELTARESPGFRWANVFRTLRLMELSGEVEIGRAHV